LREERAPSVTGAAEGVHVAMSRVEVVAEADERGFETRVRMVPCRGGTQVSRRGGWRVLPPLLPGGIIPQPSLGANEKLDRKRGRARDAVTTGRSVCDGSRESGEELTACDLS
jgi:hypothetical protein